MQIEIQKRKTEQELQEADRVYQALRRDTEQHLEELHANEQMAAEYATSARGKVPDPMTIRLATKCEFHFFISVSTSPAT